MNSVFKKSFIYWYIVNLPRTKCFKDYFLQCTVHTHVLYLEQGWDFISVFKESRQSWCQMEWSKSLVDQGITLSKKFFKIKLCILYSVHTRDCHCPVVTSYCKKKTNQEEIVKLSSSHFDFDYSKCVKHFWAKSKVNICYNHFILKRFTLIYPSIILLYLNKLQIVEQFFYTLPTMKKS